MIADPLWSCVMLLCGLLQYLVIPQFQQLTPVNQSNTQTYSGDDHTTANN